MTKEFIDLPAAIRMFYLFITIGMFVYIILRRKYYKENKLNIVEGLIYDFIKEDNSAVQLQTIGAIAVWLVLSIYYLIKILIFK